MMTNRFEATLIQIWMMKYNFQLLSQLENGQVLTVTSSGCDLKIDMIHWHYSLFIEGEDNSQTKKSTPVDLYSRAYF